jgi:SulP family sulfate permease
MMSRSWAQTADDRPRRRGLYLSGVDPTLFASWETDGTLARLGDVHVEPATDVIGESTQLALEDAFRLAPGSRP